MVSLCDGSCQAIVDSGTALIFGVRSDVEKIHKVVGADKEVCHC